MGSSEPYVYEREQHAKEKICCPGETEQPSEREGTPRIWGPAVFVWKQGIAGSDAEQQEVERRARCRERRAGEDDDVEAEQWRKKEVPGVSEVTGWLLLAAARRVVTLESVLAPKQLDRVGKESGKSTRGETAQNPGRPIGGPKFRDVKKKIDPQY